MTTTTATTIRVRITSTGTTESLPEDRFATSVVRFERLYREHTGDRMGAPDVLEIDTDLAADDDLDNALRGSGAQTVEAFDGVEAYVLLPDSGSDGRDVWARAMVGSAAPAGTKYRVTFRVGGADATEQHRTATVEADDEDEALRMAVCAVWEPTARWTYDSNRWHGRVYAGSLGVRADFLTGEIMVSCDEVGE